MLSNEECVYHSVSCDQEVIEVDIGCQDHLQLVPQASAPYLH